MFKLLVPTALLACAPLTPAAIVWEFGGDGIQTVTFFADGSNPSDPGQQDILTPNVVFARNPTGGIFNAVSETFYDQLSFSSPAGTEWAFAGLGPAGNENPPEEEFSASNFANLTFEPWADALGRNGFLPDRDNGTLLSNIIGTPGVVHLIADDIYLDIVFTDWGARGSGEWGYRRAAPIPEPSSLLLLTLAVLPFLRRKR